MRPLARVTAVLAPIALAALAACAPQFETTVRLSEIAGVLASGTPVTVPATLSIPEGSEETCAEGLAEVMRSLATITPVTGKPSCVEIDGQPYSKFPTEMPLLVAGAEPGAYLAALELAPLAADGSGAISLSARMTATLDAVARLVSGDQSALSLSPELEDPTFSFTIVNDTAGAARLNGWYVYADGEPALPDAEIELAPGASVELVVSDVVSSWLAEARAHRVAVLVPPPGI